MHHNYIDRYANQDSPVHDLDARAKVVAVLLYTVVLVSVPKYQLAPLAPFAVLPLAMLVVGRIPLNFVLKRILIVSPFVVCLAAFNPIWDAQLRPFAGTWVRGGWLVAASVLIKFTLGMGALIALTSTTRFSDLLAGLQRLGVPRVLVMQLGFLYRYLFVLIDQAMRMRRARDARLGGYASVALRLRAVGGIVGVLLLRTLEQAERIHQAMQARGYDGTVRTLRRGRFGWAEVLFLLAVGVYLTAARLSVLAIG